MLYGGDTVEKVDVVILTYKPEQKFLDLMEKLAHQTVPVNKIIIMNTEQKYFDRLTYGTLFSKQYKNVQIRHLSKREFDHGRTRNSGVRCSEAPVFVMMTQDAVPADEFLIEALLRSLEQENAAVAYGRQLAPESCTEAEKFTRNFNYPPEKAVKTKNDIEKLGIKTYFCSNVCAAYKRDVFDALGGFIKHTIFNEDMIYAANAVQAGYAVVYQPEAKVYHAHDLSCGEQFHRNFDLGVSQADHPEIFASVSSESEGVRLVKMTIAHLKEKKMWMQIPGVPTPSPKGDSAQGSDCTLPRKLVVKCSAKANREYWNR